MSLQALGSLSISSYEHKPKKSKVKKSKDANRDLGGPPKVVSIDEEVLLYEEHLLSAAQRRGYSIEWNYNPDARSYSHRYIQLNDQVNDLQVLKEVFYDIGVILSGFKDINALWINQEEEPEDVLNAANNFIEEFNSRVTMVPESISDSMNKMFRLHFKDPEFHNFLEFKLHMPEVHLETREALVEEPLIEQLSLFTRDVQEAIDRKLKDLESDAGSLLNHKVFNYEADLSIHDATEADMSVDELKESILRRSRDALGAQANQVPDLAVGLLRTA